MPHLNTTYESSSCHRLLFTSVNRLQRTYLGKEKNKNNNLKEINQQNKFSAIKY